MRKTQWAWGINGGGLQLPRSGITGSWNFLNSGISVRRAWTYSAPITDPCGSSHNQTRRVGVSPLSRFDFTLSAVEPRSRVIITWDVWKHVCYYIDSELHNFYWFLFVLATYMNPEQFFNFRNFCEDFILLLKSFTDRAHMLNVELTWFYYF